MRLLLILLRFWVFDLQYKKTAFSFLKTLFFVVLLTWRTVFEDNLVVRCGNHNRLFAVGFAVHCAGAQHITAFFAVERVHIVGFIQIDGHLDLFAFDGGRSVCGQALFVEAVGYFDFFTLLADVADGFFCNGGVACAGGGSHAAEGKCGRQDYGGQEFHFYSFG